MKDLGQAVLGLGLMFLGLKLIVDGAVPLEHSALLQEVIAALSETPALVVLIGAALSALVALDTSEIHLDVLTNLKRISSHVSALMFPILEEI